MNAIDLISVIAPICNVMPSLDDRPQSITGQTCPILEIILITGGSTCDSSAAMTCARTARARCRPAKEGPSGVPGCAKTAQVRCGRRESAPSAVQRSGVCAKRARVGCKRRHLKVKQAFLVEKRVEWGAEGANSKWHVEGINALSLELSSGLSFSHLEKAGATPHSRPF